MCNAQKLHYSVNCWHKYMAAVFWGLHTATNLSDIVLHVVFVINVEYDNLVPSYVSMIFSEDLWQ